MRHLSKMAVLFVLCAAVFPGCTVKHASAGRIPEGTPTARPEGDGWIDLFAEPHAGAWKNVTDDTTGIFELKDGLFHVPGGSGTHYVALMSESFADFQLHIEFKVAKGANSGVFVRSDPKDPVYRGIEVQVLDDCGQAPNKNGSGSIYDVVTPMFNLARPAGEWNSYDITCRGSEMEVVMNGWRVVSTDLAKMTMPIGKFDTPLAQLPREGNVILQDHGGEVWFRNLVIKRL